MIGVYLENWFFTSCEFLAAIKCICTHTININPSSISCILLCVQIKLVITLTLSSINVILLEGIDQLFFISVIMYVIFNAHVQIKGVLSRFLLTYHEWVPFQYLSRYSPSMWSLVPLFKFILRLFSCTCSVSWFCHMTCSSLVLVLDIWHGPECSFCSTCLLPNQALSHTIEKVGYGNSWINHSAYGTIYLNTLILRGKMQNVDLILVLIKTKMCCVYNIWFPLYINRVDFSIVRELL